MPFATRRGPVTTTPFSDYDTRRGTVTTAQTFWPNTLIGLAVSGFADKYGDAASMIFDGVKSGINEEVLAGGAAAGENAIPVSHPRYITIPFASTIVAADIGRTVYAVDDNTATIATTTVFGNPIGTLHAVVNSTTGVVQCEYGGKHVNRRLGAARVMAATGTQSLTKYDLNKTIFLPNTAAYTLNLPAVADTQAGDTLTFVKTTADAFAVTLDGNASETIDGATTLATIDAVNDAATLVSTGAAWIVLNRDIT